jgi:hypothetical protein
MYELAGALILAVIFGFVYRNYFYKIKGGK